MSILDPVCLKVTYKQVVGIDSTHLVADYHIMMDSAFIFRDLIEETDVSVTQWKVSLVVYQVNRFRRVVDVNFE